LASGDTEKDIAEAKKMIELKRHNIFKLKIGSILYNMMLIM
jgi:muconate cycloisomerase